MLELKTRIRNNKKFYGDYKKENFARIF